MKDYSRIVNFLKDNRRFLIRNNFDGLFEAYKRDDPLDFHFGPVIDFFLNELKINILNYFSKLDPVMFEESKATSLDFSENNKITEIPYECFMDLQNLTSVKLPPNITSIGEYSFYCCYDLTSITLPNKVATIEDNAFVNGYSLRSITIPESVTKIGDSTFLNCSSITSIIIPSSVTAISKDMFYNCHSLTSIDIPSSVTTIGYRAFCNCNNLTSITIPDSVTTIEERAFYGCPSGLVIHGKSGSYAEKYAEEYSIKFVSI